MVFRSFVLHGSSLRIPTPQGIGTGGEVGTPAALVAQRPNDDAGMVLGPLEQVPGTVEELITPGLLRLQRRLADEAKMVFFGYRLHYVLLCSEVKTDNSIYTCRQDKVRKYENDKKHITTCRWKLVH